MIKKVERLISEINKIHQLYFEDYFETGKVEKYNLFRTIKRVPLEHILNYRLNLHESHNDYLMEANLEGIQYYYRVKTSENIKRKIDRYMKRANQYPVDSWLNDIFSCRMILEEKDLEVVENILDEWQEKYGLKDWYRREKEGDKAFHIYFKNKKNFCFPWELQLWDKKDVKSNIEAHRKQLGTSSPYDEEIER